MASLKHEIWEENGGLKTMCLAGPDGDYVRQFLAPDARLIDTFEAESNFEAMSILYHRNGWGQYKLSVEQDQKPYPDDWADRQAT